jgi:hypothetical protein
VRLVLTIPLLILAALLGVGPAMPLAAPTRDEELPIFDTHIHYSSDAWSVYSVDEALAILDRAGVKRALVSSTPDDGTMLLYQRDPERIIPILRPYRARADMGSWTRDPYVLEYVEERLQAGHYRGIGEFHLYAGEVESYVPRAFVELAAQYDLFLHAHSDETAVEQLARIRSDVKILWAHAGMSASPATVGSLDPGWSALFQRHPDRFMIGTDTWVTSQWTQLPRLMANVQGWLRQLPGDVAERIAYRNAERLFGGS